ncbi:MAG TPA: hypothetical protein VG389_07775 [Myxococcota bacterium]|nr:hypothetical protein [Myxococcota bacterium]
MKRACPRGAALAAAGAVAVLAGCNVGPVPRPAAGGAGSAVASSYEGAASGLDATAVPFMRLAAYRAAGETLAAAAAAPLGGGGGGTAAADTAPAAGGSDGAGAPAAPDSAPAADGAGSAAADGDGAGPGPLDADDGTEWISDLAHDRLTFKDARAEVTMVLGSKYWSKVGTLLRADSYSVKFRLMDKNIDASLSYRPYAAVDASNSAQASAFTADFLVRMGADAKMMGGELALEGTGTGTCAGLPAVTHVMTIGGNVGVHAASLFARGRVYTVTVSGLNVMYAGDLAGILEALCKELSIGG